MLSFRHDRDEKKKKRKERALTPRRVWRGGVLTGGKKMSATARFLHHPLRKEERRGGEAKAGVTGSRYVKETNGGKSPLPNVNLGS